MLLESLIAEKYYLYLPIKLKEYVDGIQTSMFMPYKFVNLYKDFLERYEKNISSFSHNNSFNYIYKPIKPLKIFNLKDNFDWEHIEKNNMVNEKELKDYYGSQYKGVIKTTKNIKDNRDKETFLLIAINNKFKTYYDGYNFGNNDECYVFADKFLKNSELISGNKIKFKISHKKTIDELPYWVTNELIRYSNSANKKLNKEVKEWLLTNFKKPYSQIILYRGFAIDDVDVNFNKLKFNLKKMTGLMSFTDLKVNNTCYVNRQKESSWSYNKEIADAFNNGWASGAINLLVKTIAKPEQVVVDFTLLSNKLKNNFQYESQNEVILNNGKIKSTIIDIDISEDFNKLLLKNGYRFKNKIIVKK